MKVRKITIIEEETDEGFDSQKTWAQNEFMGRQYYDPCANCPNNPANNPNASGICNCVLPYMAGTRYQITCTCDENWKIT